MANAWILEPLALGTVTASNTAAGYSPSYIANDMMGVVWKSSTGAASRWIELDLGADVEADTAILLGCTGAQSAWQLRVQAGTAAEGSATGGSYNSGLLSFLAGANSPASGRGVGWWGPSAGPGARRYWRFTFSSLSNAAVTVGRLVLAKRLVLARNFAFGAAHGVRDLGGYDFSRRGVPLPKRGAKLRSIGLSFPLVHKDEAEDYILPLAAELGGQEPLGLVTDPDPHDNRQRRIFFGPLIGDLGMVERRADRWEWRANLVHLD